MISLRFLIPEFHGSARRYCKHCLSFPARITTVLDFRGSNAVAVGRDRSFNGRGMLLANPHFPWVGGMRFYEMHLTIPGHNHKVVEY